MLKHYLSCILLAASISLAAEDAQTFFEIPKLSDLKIDGSGADWGDKGFKVDSLCDVAGRTRPLADFSATFKLGWDERGLLVFVSVIDDVPLEPADKLEDLWQGDSIEFFVATAPGADKSYQVVIAPGRDPKHPELRSNISDYRKGDFKDKDGKEIKKETLSIQAARTVNEKGYTLEVLLPWKNLNIEPKSGVEFAFQIYANDADKESERYQALWYPKPDAHSDTNNTYRLRLSDSKTSPAVRAVLFGNYDGDSRLQLTLWATDAFVGKSVVIKEGDKIIASGKFAAENGRSIAKFTTPKCEKPYELLSAVADKETLCTVLVPEPFK